MSPVFAYIYGALFALAYSWAIIWITERRDKTYRQGITSFTDSFLLGAFWLLFSGITTIAVMLRAPHKALDYILAQLAFLACYIVFKEASYRLREHRKRGRLKDEMVILEHHATADPSNAVYFERASEIFEKLGEEKNALEAARRAEKLDPTVSNRWRIQQLEENSGGGKSR